MHTGRCYWPGIGPPPGWLITQRNQAAAALVEHAGWPVPEVAALARTSPEQVLAARPAVSTLHVTYADPGTVVELDDIIDSLNGRLYWLGELRSEAIRTLLWSGTPSRTVAAYGQLAPSEVEALRPALGPRIVNPWLADLQESAPAVASGRTASRMVRKLMSSALRSASLS